MSRKVGVKSAAMPPLSHPAESAKQFLISKVLRQAVSDGVNLKRMAARAMLGLGRGQLHSTRQGGAMTGTNPNPVSVVITMHDAERLRRLAWISLTVTYPKEQTPPTPQDRVLPARDQERPERCQTCGRVPLILFRYSQGFLVRVRAGCLCRSMTVYPRPGQALSVASSRPQANLPWKRLL
jgi:hypothetical protein